MAHGSTICRMTRWCNAIQCGLLLDLGTGEEQRAGFPVRAGLVGDQGDEGIEHTAQQFDQLAAGYVAGAERRVDLLGDRGDAAFDDLADVIDDGAIQALLVAEIILQRRKVDVGALGEGARAGALVALGGEHLQGGAQDAQAGILAALLASRRGGPGRVAAWRRGQGRRRSGRRLGGLAHGRGLYQSIFNVNRSI